MKNTLKLVLQGLGTVLPLGITIYAIIWLATVLEQLAGQALLFIFPRALYFPGLGLIAGVGMLFVVGLMMNMYGMRHLVTIGDRIVQKIPLVKSIYASIKDIITVFQLGKSSDLSSVVSVDMGNNIYQIGFVTGAKTGKRLFPDQDRVGVYLPMSYQIGGFTMYVERERLTELNIGVEEAMRIALTGGAQSEKTAPRKKKAPASANGDSKESN